MVYISIFSTILAFAFAFSVFNRYRDTKRTYLLLWTFGLVLYGIGTLSEVIMSFAFSVPVLKIWYLSGAMLTAAWLGQGTVHLLVRKKGVAPTLSAILAVLSVIATILVILAPITGAAESYEVTQPLSSQYQDIMVRNGVIIFMTIILNLYGTVTLVGGAIYSAFLFWRKKVLVNRMLGNILIAAGALLPALGGSFLKAGMGDVLYISEFLGVIVMYAGFLLAITPAAVVEGEGMVAAE
ncbi:MAG: hypothetical protein GTO18_06105 [Anaerolineales bacterium]|nr:hypothetical protein [Anaerolineales bacterium]